MLSLFLHDFVQEAARRIHKQEAPGGFLWDFTILGCRFKGVQEPNMQTLEIFYITCYESKTMGQSSCSNPGIVLRRFIRHVKYSATISYSPVNNKSPFLKFLSDC